MTRLTKFKQLKDHPMHGKMYNRLTLAELQTCLDFITNTLHLNRNEFTLKVNRWFLDNPVKPKHHMDMWALVSQSITE